MHLKLLKQDEVVFEIELLENPFVDKFLSRLIYMNETYQFSSSILETPGRKITYDPVSAKTIGQELRSTISILNSRGYKFPIPEDKIYLDNNEASTQLLNKLSLYFYCGHKSVSHREAKTTWDYTDESLVFQGPAHESEYQEFSNLCHKIARLVREMNKFYINDNLALFPSAFHVNIDFDTTKPKAQELDQNYYIDFTEEDFELYSSNDLSYDVWVKTFEQGKLYLNAFFDIDDPTQPNISQGEMYTGSFVLGHQKSLQYPKYLKWLDNYGMDLTKDKVGIPLGRIIKGAEDMYNYMSLLTFTPDLSREYGITDIQVY
jgi:hypothetical protein